MTVDGQAQNAHTTTQTRHKGGVLYMDMIQETTAATLESQAYVLYGGEGEGGTMYADNEGAWVERPVTARGTGRAGRIDGGLCSWGRCCDQCRFRTV